MKKFICILIAMIGIGLTVNAQIPTEGLVAYYPFNGNANDESGNGNNGTVIGATLTSDRFGNAESAYYFNKDEISVADNNSLDFTNNFSICVWFKSDNTVAYLVQGIIGKLRNENGGRYSIQLANPGDLFGPQPDFPKILFGFNTGPTGATCQFHSDNLLSRWHCLIGTYDGQSLKLYIDSELVDEQSTSLILPTDNTPLYIGRESANVDASVPDGSTVRYFYGDLDDVRIYNRPLNESEVQEVYQENGFAIVADIDGNVYNTVTIGTQTWMKENLKTTKYRNGDAIPNVTGNTAWINLANGAYCDYGNTPNNSNSYGRLYNFYTVIDARNICPLGWHVPSDAEWKTLEIFLGMTQIQADSIGWRGTNQGTQLKNETGWNSGNGTNTSGFSGLAGGFRNGIDGTFGYMGDLGYWWSSTKITSDDAFRRNFYSGNAGIDRGNALNPSGISLRCLKDSDKSLTISDVTVNEGQPLDIPVSVSTLTAGDNIISYQFDVTFDKNVVQYTGNTVAGTIAAGGTVVVNTNVAGKLSVSYMRTTAIVGAGNILKLQFNSLKVDTITLAMTNAYLNTTPIQNLTNGIVIVKDITPSSAAITYNDIDVRYADALLITATFNEPMLATNAVKLTLSGASTLSASDMTRQSSTVYTYSYSVPKGDGIATVTLSNGTDVSGNPLVSTPTSGGSFSIIKLNYGDVDDDSKILAYDAALTLQRSVGLDPLPAVDPIPWENWRDSTANVDGVAGITANDAGMILQYSAGIIIAFDAQGKKSTSGSIADVTVSIENQEIVFRSNGELFGLNISAINTDQILGTPSILVDNFMSAFNINGTTYNLGLCTAYSPENGAAFMKIPYNKNGSVTFNMIINTEEKTVTVDLVTGMVEFSNDKISIYPNPVKDILKISGLTSPTVASIYNTNGKLLISSKLNNASAEINVSDLPVGVYVIKLQTDKEIAVKRFAIK